MTATFTFTHAEQEYTIPAFRSMPIGVLRKARKGANEMDQTFLILETALGDDDPALAAIDTMTPSEFEVFIKGWTQGAGVGEA